MTAGRYRSPCLFGRESQVPSHDIYTCIFFLQSNTTLQMFSIEWCGGTIAGMNKNEMRIFWTCHHNWKEKRVNQWRNKYLDRIWNHFELEVLHRFAVCSPVLYCCQEFRATAFWGYSNFHMTNSILLAASSFLLLLKKQVLLDAIHLHVFRIFQNIHHKPCGYSQRIELESIGSKYCLFVWMLIRSALVMPLLSRSRFWCCHCCRISNCPNE